MSNRTVGIEALDTEGILEQLRQWVHVPIVVAFMVFMVYVRLQNYDNVAMEGGSPRLSAVDSWYHWRTITWSVENFPWTMPFDVFTRFATGTYVGSFGTLFDQLIALAALVVGLGDPSTQTVYEVALVSVPVMAALTAIPMYVIGSRIGGKLGGIVSVALLALTPSSFLQRSIVGNLDHHVAEVLFMAIAVASLLVALRVGEEEMPIWELIRAGDWNAIRRPAIFSTLAGVGFFLYLWVWPAGIVLVGITAVFLTIHLCLDFVRGVSPDHVAFVGAVSMGVTGMLFSLKIEVLTTQITSFGLLQPGFAFATAAGCIFMAWFAREWEQRSIEPIYYPGAIGVLLLVGLGAMAVVVPDVFNTLTSNLLRRITPIDPTSTTLTIVEAQPPDDFTQQAFTQFGTAFYTMFAGLALLAIRPFMGRKYRAEYSFIIIWGLFLTSMAVTQQRFWYYFALAVAAGNAALIGDVIRFLELDIGESVSSIRDVETYQVIVAAMVVLLLFAPIIPPVANATAMEMGTDAQPSPDGVLWEQSNEWLADNSPMPGDYGGASNSGDLPYNGTFEIPDGMDYDYPDGAYGVMSWWDYGHLITTQSNRIPVANPFQQNARPASAFFTAESEERSEVILDAHAAGIQVEDQSTEELRSQLEEREQDEAVRYVMIDYAMAAGKFSAISQWTGPDYNHYRTPADYQPGETIMAENVSERMDTLPYRNTTLSRLYLDDAFSMEHYRLVHEDERFRLALASYAIVQNGQLATHEDGTPAVFLNQQVTRQDLQQLQSNPNYQLIGLRQPAGVKTFERVPGATITGSTDNQELIDNESAVVLADVEMRTNTGRNYTYRQRTELSDDGSFELTVPYATDNELGVEDGYTNSSVVAEGPYQVAITTPGAEGFAPHAMAQPDVPETAVVNGETIEVDLQPPGEFMEPEIVANESG